MDVNKRISQKVKGLFKKQHIYCKYTETRLTLLFNVIPIDFKPLIPAFHRFLIPSEKKVLIMSLTNFSPRQFLERIVTADETWLYHYEPESKAQSVAWKRPISSLAKKFKSQPSAGKIMLTIFWDIKGAILVHFTPKGETVDSYNYCDVLRTKLKPETSKKARCKIG
jgi:hypothetical protein